MPDEHVLHDKRADTLSSTAHNIEGRKQLSFSCLTLRGVVEKMLHVETSQNHDDNKERIMKPKKALPRLLTDHSKELFTDLAGTYFRLTVCVFLRICVQSLVVQPLEFENEKPNQT